MTKKAVITNGLTLNIIPRKTCSSLKGNQMKATELIQQLEELIARNGDLEIRQYGYYGNFPVTDIGLFGEDEHNCDLVFLLEPGQFHDTYL